ncbi:sigma-54-dependent Fis family transcriptional regulator [Acidisoma cellulosilytica]|uniref:Sigma-54-dependent Fis family transcriptional regulator n=1 Tax=Acidisoma cellulosilyticum TaxID=2802395 RepID=A0A963Z802_9PROT|nr:sigma-54-dependent Fis family transcriptional regulator [Acidisoma cellulosilyticum]MCB8883745.1 sigma-54-dependent Fis family transcriptional regulator [Acidisoma cellulosilyticum]
MEPYRDIIELGLFELSALINPSGYEVSFCTKAGVTILNLPASGAGGVPSLECPGSLWTEETEGTNGVGTSLWEARPVSLYKSDHFLSRYTDNCCAAAPVFASSGDILGVLNITTSSESVSRELHQMAYNILIKMAEKVERRLFRHYHRDHCLVEMRVSPGQMALVAAREEGSLIAADRHAMNFLRATGYGIDGKSLWNYFDRDNSFFTPGSSKSVALVHKIDGVRIPSKIHFPIRSPLSSGRPDHVARAPVTGSRSLLETVGSDPKMIRNAGLLQRVRGSTLPVLLLGETGTGKDVLARAIHADGPRSHKPFVALNCAAMPETLIDSELFGYSSGAFTGARKEGQTGRIMQAEGGTLFLDEIGDMPVALQTRLLRFLENAEVTPIGGGAVRRVDVRVIAATNVSVAQAAREGRFRADLYYRLAGVVVNLPTLRERTDFPEVVAKILADYPAGAGMSVSSAAMALLQSYEWPGNLRELRNVLQRAACVADDGMIQEDHLFFDIEINAGVTSTAIAPPAAISLPPSPQRGDERAMLMAALRDHNDDAAETAKALQMSRATFYRRLKEFGIRPRGTRRIQMSPTN